MFERVKEESFHYYDRLARVRIFVEEKGNEPITLTEAAQVAAMETTYFSAFFKERVGISFTDWLRRVRIAKAMEIMREKDCRICDVAFAVGFGDVGTFSRAFKRYANQTPQDFKRSSRP